MSGSTSVSCSKPTKVAIPHPKRFVSGSTKITSSAPESGRNIARERMHSYSRLPSNTTEPHWDSLSYCVSGSRFSRTNDEKSFQLPFFHDDRAGDEVAVVKIQYVVDANELAFLPMDQKQIIKSLGTKDWGTTILKRTFISGPTEKFLDF